MVYYFSVEWKDLIKIDELNADDSTKIYQNRIIIYQVPMYLLNSNKYKLELKSEPWITLGLKKS